MDESIGLETLSSNPVDAAATTAASRTREISAEADHRFRRWRADRSVPLVRVGMGAAFAAGWVLIGVGVVFDPQFTRAFLPAVAVASPGFLIAIASTSQRHRRWVHVTALVGVLAWGMAVIWGAHEALNAPELGTLGLILVGLFGFQVFRIPSTMLVPGMLVLTLGHVTLLATTSDQPIAGGAAFHHAVSVLVIGAGALIGLTNDRTDRRTFEYEETIVAQRKEIEAERRRSDLLLHKILPSPVVERLKTNGATLVDHHDAVTVLFADLVGFTPLTSRLSPEELIATLDLVFGWIDGLAAHHGVEKIKTIGDAYMAAAGVPEPKEDHVTAVADLALDLRDGLEALVAGLPHPIEMRIGMATGDAVAGVIGDTRFVYDLWSDTVNTAARLESTGLPGRIHLDGPTADSLRDAYLLEPRGFVDLKGKGSVQTWFLEGPQHPPSFEELAPPGFSPFTGSDAGDDEASGRVG